jgi:uncharacterized protein (DUF2236 family)
VTQDTSEAHPVAPGCPVSPLGYEAPPQPLGSDSLTWRYFGDWRGMLQGPWAGSMQNMHPQLGAAVEDHSTFFRERWPRLLRSLYPIGGVVFDGDRAPTTGAEVRDYHIEIKGTDSQGRRYHALNPDVFYWAHSTFFVGTIHVAERFCGGLTEAQKRQLFDEHIEWYRMYGMSMRPVPKSWEDFQVYWDHMCSEVLENNFAAREVLNLTELPKPPFAQWIPDRLWACAAQTAGAVLRLGDGWSVRPVGAQADGLQLVTSRRVAAPPLRRRRPPGLRRRAVALPQASTSPGRLRPGQRPDSGRYPVGADTGPQPAAARRARRPKALLPQRRLTVRRHRTRRCAKSITSALVVGVLVNLLEPGLVQMRMGVLGPVMVGMGVLVLDVLVLVIGVRMRVLDAAVLVLVRMRVLVGVLFGHL